MKKKIAYLLENEIHDFLVPCFATIDSETYDDPKKAQENEGTAKCRTETAGEKARL